MVGHIGLAWLITIPATALVAEGPPRATFVVVERQADDHWLVLSQTHQLDPVE